ncbi:MAG: TIR domain-containing protein [Cyanobacteria bacterium P01_H01_bin.15]
MVGKGDLQIFLAHASEDKETVRALYWRLKDSGYKPWLDEEDILPGQQCQQEIPKAIRNSGIFLACYSKHAVFKETYIQKELRYALMELANKPPGTIYFVPLRLEDCGIPALEIPDLGLKLTDFQWLDFWKENSFEKLEKTFQLRLEQLAKATSQQLAKPDKPIVIATKSIGETTTIENAYEIFQTAFKLQELGRNEEAISSFDRALEIKPDDHGAWNNRGIALGNLSRNEDAIAI